MKSLLSAFAVYLFLSLSANAQPASVTATCKDGTAFSGSTRSGACSGHGGVQTWGTTAPAATAPTQPTTSTGSPAATEPPGGGPGMVWVNTASKVYHCPGDRWYGKTKAGEYMTEAKARAAGSHADHGKACSP
jgi:hypothetical protein